MACSDPQERQRSPFRLAPVLLPVAERMHTDAERLRELSLRQSDEAAEGSHVAGVKLAAHDALTLTATQSSCKVGPA